MMVILGLGSNVGDRLGVLRQALFRLEQLTVLRVLQVSPLYLSDALLPENAPASWDMPYINLAVRCATDAEPHALLHELKNIEILLGRKPEKVWHPRPVDIDILVWDDRVINDAKLQVPHEHLVSRPFALWPLADVAQRWVCPEGEWRGKTAAEMCAQWGSRFTGTAPLHTRQIAQRIDTPQLVGILNITPDSFSDPHAAMTVSGALNQARELSEAGADILDIGAEATSPDAPRVTAEQEWQRLEKILQAIVTLKTTCTIPPKISVDTRRPFVAAKALEFGVDWINDVSGLSDPAMRELLAGQNCDIVIMHELGVPSDQTRTLPAAEHPGDAVFRWMEKTLKALSASGISPHRIILDVGIGFGKNPAQSLALIQSISHFKKLHQRLLVGHSRKSFLQQFTQRTPAERDVETLPISLYLARQKIDYLRLHNVDMCARAFKVERTLTTLATGETGYDD
jgi:dihydropteroate synthase/2-amino-4-hydroxy-6-hydroxymethyldihydropteridine diphosphokinase